MINLRIFFTKTGRLKYIGHLDVSRMMQRALKRAGLPVWYTEGFNPHLYVTFSLPLPLGYESLCESMDLRLTQPLPFEEVKDRLNAVLPEDVRVTAVQEPVLKPSDIAAAEYEIQLVPKNASPDQLESRWNAYLGQEQIPVVKRTKKGPKTMDLKPEIQVLGQKKSSEAFCLTLLLPAGLANNINPTLALDNFQAFADTPEFYARITRTRLFGPEGRNFT